MNGYPKHIQVLSNLLDIFQKMCCASLSPQDTRIKPKLNAHRISQHDISRTLDGETLCRL